MAKEHIYSTQISWTGNDGAGTISYESYRRDFTVACVGKPDVFGSSDPAFRGDSTRYNPEELLVASLSSCHMLWYLHLCAENSITVLEYSDLASGYMEESPDGKGRFTGAELHPRVTISDSSLADIAIALHQKAHDMCFIARSVNFPVDIVPKVFRDSGGLKNKLVG